MNRNVPPGAAVLLEFIGKIETGHRGPGAYLTVIGYKQDRLRKPLTQFRLDELCSAQDKWRRQWGVPSNAAGKYQIVRPTLLSLITELGLPTNLSYSPEVQDWLGYALLLRRGYAQFATGETDIHTFGNELAKEWASLPVLADMQGAHVPLARGASFYSGDGVNKALVKPEDVEAVLTLAQDAVLPAPHDSGRRAVR